MTSPKRTTDEYKAVAEFFQYISRPEVDAKWHMDTGYVPITLAGHRRSPPGRVTTSRIRARTSPSASSR